MFLVGGLGLKGLLVLLWRLFKLPGLLGLLTTYDPAAFWFAENAKGLFFDQRRFAPTPAESVTFELLLILGFGIECLVVGFIISWFLRKPRRPGHIESGSPVAGR
jgi:hypothetical protein